ncbi:MAG: 30S ribosomal protein S16 [Pseudobdellovibrio sp.]|uniref:30S ribosomal protein S16 n=1 Tax=Pseudobdellovibrio sp. HCB154 TaxID=3386277 RepID=UPI0039170F52|nr:30S ribosomal protein S16 [Pseudobdellovibrio sp.]
MVVIRLARVGAKHDPKYRITVADSRRYVTGKFIEVLGTYIPTPKGKQTKVVLNTTKAQEWLAKGAQPSETVRHVLKLGGVTLPARKKSPSKTKNKNAKKEA